MSIQRPLPKSLFPESHREILSSRNDFAALSKSPREISKSDKISQSLASCFSNEEENSSLLADEIPNRALNYIIGESRALMAVETVGQAHWDALSGFLSEELQGFVDLKKQLNQAQRDCEAMLKITEEVCDSPNGEVSPNRILEVALALQEAKMRRDNFRARVKSIIDGLCKEILAGNSSGDSLEIRLRGVLGKLG
ncbi:hypothetical protein OAF84_02665 [Akkermansiaceae bacterium]|nr:hypothetical protein [Akkermansiaceae bacterium]